MIGGLLYFKFNTNKVPEKASNIQKVSEEIDLNNYKNAALGIEFSYHKDWKLFEDKAPTGEVVSLELYESEGMRDLPSPSINITFFDSVPFLPQPEPEYNMTDFTPITVAGVQGRQTEDKPSTLGRVGGCREVYKVQLPLKNGTLAISGCKGSTNYLPQMQIIFDSLKFI